jgi:hypothetical protein
MISAITRGVRAENSGPHAVEHLDTDQPEIVIGEGIEHRTEG